MEIKANVKYTAVELLAIAGIKNPESKFGKAKIRIGGLSGINTPNHIIRVGAEAKEVEVICGDDKVMLTVAEVLPEANVTKNAKAALEEKGRQLAESQEQTTEEEPEEEPQG